MPTRFTIRNIWVAAIFLITGIWSNQLLAQQDTTCPTSAPLVITVHQEPAISITGQTTICEGGTATLNATISGGTGTCTINWQVSTNGGTSWADIPGATNAAYTTPVLTATTQYRARYSCVGPSGATIDCDEATSNVQTITVQPDPTIVVTGAGVTICTGGGLTLTATVTNGTGTITYQWQASTNGGTTWTNVGTNSNIYNTGALTQTTDYKVLISITGVGCDGTESVPVTVTVVPDPDISIIGATTICVGGTATLTATVSGGTGTCGIQWQYLNGATWTDLPGETSTTLNTGVMASSRIYRAKYNCSGLQCDERISNTQQITVTSDPSVSVSGGAITVCVGGGATLTTSVTGGAGTASYQWQISTDGTTFTDIAGATNTILVVTNLPATRYYRVQVTFSASGCDPVYSGVSTLNVVPDPDVSISGVQPVCVGGSLLMTAVSSGGTGTCTIRWQRRVGTNWVPMSPGNQATQNTGVLSVPNSINIYRVIYSCTGGGCSADTSNIDTVRVFADPLITLQPVGDTICQEGTHTMTTAATGGTPGLIYQWQFRNGASWANVSDGLPTGAVYTGNTTTSLTVAGIANVGSYEYRVFADAVGIACDSSFSNSAIIEVVKDPEIDTQPVGGTICAGGSQTMSVVASGGVPGLDYQWQYNNGGTWVDVSAGIPAGANYAGENTADMTVTGITPVGSHNYRVIVSATGSDCDPIVSNDAIVIIVPAPSINEQAVGATICVGGTHNMSIAASGGTPGLNYQWQYENGAGNWVDVSNNLPAGSTYAGATTGSMTVTGITVTGTHPYRVLVSSTGSNCGQQVSQTVNVIVVPDPSIDVQAVGASICVGGTHTMAITASGGTPGLTYRWEYFDGTTWSNVSAGVPAGATYTGATTNSLNVNGISATGTYDYRVIVAASGSDCATQTSATVSVIVVPDPAITTQPVGESICVGGTHTMNIVATGGTPGLNYQWQYLNGATWANVSNGIPSGAAYAGATTNSLTVNSITVLGNHQYRVVVTSAGSDCGQQVSNPAIVTIVPAPSIDDQPDAFAICVGGVDTLFVTASGGTPSLAYQWQYNNGGSWVNVTAGQPTGATYSDPTDNFLVISGITATGTHDYRVVVSSTGSNCASQVSSIAIVTVIKDPVVDVQPVGASICVGGQYTTSLTASGGTPSLNYQWQLNNSGTWVNVSNGLPSGAVYTGANTNSLNIAGISVAGTYEYRNVITATGSDCNQTISNIINLEVVPDPLVTLQPVGATICNEGTHTMNITASGGTPSLTYQWQYEDGAGNWVNVSNGIPTGAAYTGGTTVSLTVAGISNPGGYNYRVLVNASGNGCGQAVSNAATITVNEEASATIAGGGIIVCEEGTASLVATVTGGTGTPSYQWQFRPQGGSWANVTTGTGYTTLNFTTPQLMVTTEFRIVVTYSGSGCDVYTSDPVTVTVVPDPVISISGVQDICIGGSVVINAAVTGGTGTCTIYWQHSTDNGASFDDLPGVTGPTFTTPALNNNTQYKTRIVCTGSGCCN